MQNLFILQNLYTCRTCYTCSTRISYHSLLLSCDDDRALETAFVSFNHYIKKNEYALVLYFPFPVNSEVTKEINIQ